MPTGGEKGLHVRGKVNYFQENEFFLPNKSHFHQTISYSNIVFKANKKKTVIFA
jgi:hypothetical protein